MKKLSIALIYGGTSEEREVSLMSGENIAKALKQDYDLKIYDPKDGLNALAKDKDQIDLALPIIHGTPGEDGAIQGFLELIGIPYFGSGVAASAIGMDKLVFKRLVKYEHIPVPKTKVVNANNFEKPGFTDPWFVKPNNQGSSLGVSSANNMEELQKAVKLAHEFDSVIHIEQQIKGQEFTIPVMEKNQKAFSLPVIEIIPKEEFFNYKAKYNGTTTEITPAETSPALTKKLQDIALKVFKITKAKDLARIDIMLDKHNQPYVLEINTMPGLTSESLVPKSAKAGGYPFKKFLKTLITNAWQRARS